MLIHLTHLSDRVADQRGVLNIVDRLLAVPVAKRVLPGDHEIEGSDHLLGTLTQIDAIAEHRTHESYKAARRADHLHRIPMSHYELVVGVHVDKLVQEQRMPRVLQCPAAG